MFLIVIFLLMMALSVGRQVGLNIPSGDDFAAWCMVGDGVPGLAHTFKRGEMIRVGLLLERLAGGRVSAIEILCARRSRTGFIAYFAWYAGGMTYDSWRFDDMSQGVIAVPLWIPQLGYSAGSSSCSIAIVDELVHVAPGPPADLR